jgi:hypothetical protein
MFLRQLVIGVAALCVYSQAAHAEVTISIDTSLADRTLGLLCTGQPVDEAAVRASPVVQAEIQHNSGLIAAATMDAYVAALRGASACQAPTPDPFRIADVIADPERFRAKVNAIKARETEIASAVAERLETYMPAGADYRGEVILAVPYFSCGGFAAQGRFFIDIRCLASDLETDMATLTIVIAHETFHAVQDEMFFESDVGAAGTTPGALSRLFTALLHEGSATYVSGLASLPATGGGPMTQLNRRFVNDNASRMRVNFALLTILFEHVRRATDPEASLRNAYSIGFSGGSYQEMGYHVGARIAGDIETAWGRPALACVMALPPEQFVLAHDAVASASTVEPALFRLGAPAVEAARYLARRRGGQHGFASCRPQ